MLTKELILKKLEANKEKIRSYGVEKISLFGSFAYDKQNRNSDIDFLVEFKKNSGLFKDFVGLSNLLRELFDKDIDIVKPHLVRDELKSYILEGKKIEAKI